MKSKAWYDNYESHFWNNLVFVHGLDECWPARNLCGRGYGGVTFKGKFVGAHVMAYRLSKKEEIPKGMEVCHTCDNPPCCNPKHLFLGTRKDNAQDCIKKGRKVISPGEKNGMFGKAGSLSPTSKLTESEVIEIRAMRRQRIKAGVIAEKFKITPALVSHICHGRIWKHIPVGRIPVFNRAAKLTREQVEEIKKRLNNRERQRAIAEDYGVSQAHISRIKLNQAWH